MTKDKKDILAGLDSSHANREFPEEVQPGGWSQDDAWAEPLTELGWGALSSNQVPLAPAYPVAIAREKTWREYSFIPDIHKIAVVLDFDLKDMLLALPALDALRLAYPQAEIVLMGLPWHAQFWEGRPGPINRVFPLPMDALQHELPDQASMLLEGVLDDLAGERFDLALQLGEQAWGKSPSIRQLGARHTAGFRAFNDPLLDRWLPYAYYQLDTLRYLEAVSLVGAEPLSLEARLVVTGRDCSEISWLELYGSQPRVAIYPGAPDPRRRWPAEKFAEVASALVRQGVRVLLVGLPEDMLIVNQVAAACTAPVENLCGQLSLRGMAALFSQMNVVVANESGPLHLAQAVGAATTGIFWCADLISSGPLTRGRHRPAVSWRVQCPICGMDSTRSACGHLDSFVADVPAAEVLASTIELARKDETFSGFSFSPVFERE